MFLMRSPTVANVMDLTSHQLSSSNPIFKVLQHALDHLSYDYVICFNKRNHFECSRSCPYTVAVFNLTRSDSANFLFSFKLVPRLSAKFGSNTDD